MKKHKQTPEYNVFFKFYFDLLTNDNFGFYSIISHQYIDYYFNEIILNLFENPQILIDDFSLGTFNNKFKILKSTGIFNQYEDLAHNIELINQVRNYYAHHMMITQEMPLEIEKIISKIKLSNLEKSLTAYLVSNMEGCYKNDFEKNFKIAVGIVFIQLFNLSSSYKKNRVGS